MTVAELVERRQQRWQRYLADVQAYAQLPQPLQTVGTLLRVTGLVLEAAGVRVPVLAYVLCLSAMAAQTGALALAGDPRGRVLAVGGALFMLSDALLATNKFAGPLPLANLWILSTYWAAQWCIASWLAPNKGA